MQSFQLYGDILKTQLFRLGGFVVKKNRSDQKFIILNKVNNYYFINPTLIISQLVNIFKFYSGLVLHEKKLIVASFIKNNVFFNLISSFSSFKFIYFSPIIGGLFTNKSGVSWSMLKKNLSISHKIPSLAVSLDLKSHSSILKELFCLSIPVIGFMGPDVKNEYITYPLFIKYNFYILYFFVRLFLRLLYIYKYKV